MEVRTPPKSVRFFRNALQISSLVISGNLFNFFFFKTDLKKKKKKIRRGLRLRSFGIITLKLTFIVGYDLVEYSGDSSPVIFFPFGNLHFGRYK